MFSQAQLLEALNKNFSLSEFRKGQEDIISAILAGRDVLAVLPTGGGKSLCYQLPAVVRKQLVIVISPLIALMRDQVAALQKLGIPSGCLHSGQTEDAKRTIFQDINKGGTYILYLSPERVQKDGFKQWIKSRAIALFAIDEAHCVSQWGHDFREEYTQLNILKEIRPDVPVLALTASATPNVLFDISKCLGLRNPEKKVHGFYRPNLYYQVETCSNDQEKLQWLKKSIASFPEGRKLIYCGTRRVTEELSAVLSEDFESVGHYHAGLGTKERNKTQEDYINGDIKILVATNAFGMGIDQSDVRLVVHYQLPANIDSLYQEMGRAGRDGQDSTCLLLYAKADKGLQSYFIFNSEARKAIKDLRLKNLEALVNYADGGECRHAEILTYFKDAQRIERCGHCDVCLPQSFRRVKPPEISLPAAKVRTKTAKKTSSLPVILDPVQESRFQSLRSWRKQKAIELDLPAFVVFSDQTLRHLAVANPTNLDELKNVHGIGDAKLEKFGSEILLELKM